MPDIRAIQNGTPMTLGRQAALTAQLAFPTILAQLSSILMQYIDTSMVGRLGADDSASIGLVSTTLWLFWGVCSMMTVGFSVQVAHRVGAKDYSGARDVIRQSLICILSASAAIALAGIILSPYIPRWLGGEPAITSAASTYFMIFAAGLPLLSLNYMCGGILRAAGNTRIPAILNIAMCVLDVILNFILIFKSHSVTVSGYTFVIPGAGLGVTGAAIATVAAECITALLILYYLTCRQKDLAIRNIPGSFRPRHAVVKSAVKIATPLTLEHALICGAQIAITVIVAPLGVVAIAANAFAVTAESLCYMPGYGIGDAATTLTGQSHGARRPQLVKSFGFMTVGMGMLVMTVMGVLLYVCAPILMELLSPVEAISRLGTEVLRIEAFAEPMFAASIVAYGAFVGVGDTVVPAVMNFVSIWVVRVPLAAIMAPRYGLQGIWIAMCIELCFRGTIFLWRLFSCRWIKTAAHHDITPEGVLPPDDF
ncbi:MAG: MATE family efflux transporter [Muribaculum sp.]|nr:MATE family efflux transporter [Muribaculum sp.]